MIHNLRYFVLLLAGETHTLPEEIQLSADIIGTGLTETVSQMPSSSRTLILPSSPQTSSSNDILSSISSFSRKRINKNEDIFVRLRKCGKNLLD